MSVIVGMPAEQALALTLARVPPVLYKYTDDAGLAGMKEGLIRFGDLDEYRNTEGAIGDRNEGALSSRGINFVDPRTGRIVTWVVSICMPGLVFCLSKDKHIFGAFDGRYKYRVAVQSKPFLLAVHRALASDRFFIMRQGKRFSVESALYERVGERWQKMKEKKVRIFYQVGSVEYRRKILVDIHPAQMIETVAFEGKSGVIRLLSENSSSGDTFIKHVQFAHEKEFRLCIDFAPSGEQAKPLSDDSAYCDVYRHKSALFVSIENSRDVFSFP